MESQWRRARVLTLSKPVLSTMGRGHHMDGRPLRAGLCARPEISPDSNLQKTFGCDYKPRSPVRILFLRHAKRSHTHVRQLWKTQSDVSMTMMM